MPATELRYRESVRSADEDERGFGGARPSPVNHVRFPNRTSYERLLMKFRVKQIKGEECRRMPTYLCFRTDDACISSSPAQSRRPMNFPIVQQIRPRYVDPVIKLQERDSIRVLLTQLSSFKHPPAK